MNARNESSEWQRAWDGVIAAIGSDWESTPRVGADRIEPGAVRRCLEVLEFNCALHSDPAVARAQGYPDIIVPYMATLAWTLPPMWQPGETLFDSAERDAQPPTVRSSRSTRPWSPPSAAISRQIWRWISSGRPVWAND